MVSLQNLFDDAQDDLSRDTADNFSSEASSSLCEEVLVSRLAFSEIHCDIIFCCADQDADFLGTVMIPTLKCLVAVLIPVAPADVQS